MFSAADNELLVRTGPRTAMGEYFRRFWQPVALARELEPDGAPVRVRVMGEDFVAFRDSRGQVGLVEPRCAHRGADLFFGRNEECGLRCIYHGWKYDVEGRCVELPNVPPGSAYQGKMAIRACPTREFGDIVWAYLGPGKNLPGENLPGENLAGEKLPGESLPAALPQLEFGLLPPEHRYVTKRLMECNWAQSMEGALDTAHFSFLHMPAPGRASSHDPTVAADERRIRWLRNDPLPEFTVREHEVGFVVGGSRKAEEEGLYWRITQFMLPAHSVTPSAMPGETYYGYTWVPIDDESCWIYVYAWHPERPLPAAERAKYEKGGYGQFAALGEGYVPLANRGNDFLIDREAQKHTSFTGVRGIAEQDALAQASQGLIADRTREHLTATDAAVVRFRRLMLEEATALRDGREPEAPRRPAGYRVRAGGCVAQAGLTFEQVMEQRFGDVCGIVR